MFTGTTFIFQNSEKKLFSSLNIYAVSIFFKGIVSSVFQQLKNFNDFILKVDLKIQIVCVYHYFYLMNLWSQCNIVLNGFKKTANTEKKNRGNVINRKTEEISVMRQDFLKVFFECFPHS